MTLQTEPFPLAAGDAELETHVKDAFVPCLLAALALALDAPERFLTDELRPKPVEDLVQAIFDSTGGFTPDQTTAARALALRGLIDLRAAQQSGTLPPISKQRKDEIVKRTLDWLTGGRAGADYVDLCVEELAPFGEDPRAPKWRAGDVATQKVASGADPLPAKDEEQLGVVVIGAGMSGILSAIRLKQAVIPFVVLEKNNTVAGTWAENIYPHARVDSSNLFYSYTFAQRLNWPKLWSPQPTLLEYFDAVADKFDIKKYIRFGEEVLESVWDESRNVWEVRTAKGQKWTTRAIITCVGQLNRPKIPEIKGQDVFKGPAFHTATWRSDVDLKDKKILVIGTGSSASQCVPAIAPLARHVSIIQRTRNYYFTNPAYHDDIPSGQKFLYAHVPGYANWERFWQFFNISDGLLPGVAVDPDCTAKEYCGKLNKIVGEKVVELMLAPLKDRPDLIEKVKPDYPIGTKRVALETGAWMGCLLRPNVELLDGWGVEELTEHGAILRDPQGGKKEEEFDVIIYGTGFYASKFLHPMRFKGVGGKDLHEFWAGDARAYAGITVPGFPNLMMTYGPNTNIVVNGSIVFFSEAEVGYILQLLHEILSPDGKCYKGAFDCKKEVFDKYQVFVDEGNAKRAWGRPGSEVNSWYKNEFGRVAQNWPGNCLEYHNLVKHLNPDDFNWTQAK